ncbi:PREDICTED: probable guanine nucleotide exchange factor MCF2L2 [Galeopterus variegatus]|uniref:Probable guanine nucleotide exchange factor MCF2L2 n=1 Tax=Galeopterus variegatus TaxID=482537 RepID=A0ABM0QQU1_GALVR|nr:PREDICTED: probable guanine nucleotide exchange factor MCF2L2 [Galeopterus variegatus]
MLLWLKEDMALQELTRRLATVITHVDEIMQQEVRPLVAVDIMEQLHRQFAILSGGRGEDGAPIITFPEFAGFQHVSDEDFLNVMTYLTSIPSAEAASIGFIIVIDRRRDKWSSVKASLTRIAVAFPGNLQLIFILRPSRFIQRAFTDIGIKYYRGEFKMKVPVSMTFHLVSICLGHVEKMACELGFEERWVSTGREGEAACWAEGTACVKTQRQEVHLYVKSTGSLIFVRLHKV